MRGLLSSAARPARRRRSARTATRKHTNVSAFISVFPMNAPRYAVYMMLDEPHGNKSTYGYSTAGWVAAPAAGTGDRADRRRCSGCCPTCRMPPRSTRRSLFRCSPRARRVRPRRWAPGHRVARRSRRPSRRSRRRQAGRRGSGRTPPRRRRAATRSSRPDPRHEAAVVPPPAARLLPVSVALPPIAAR